MLILFVIPLLLVMLSALVFKIFFSGKKANEKSEVPESPKTPKSFAKLIQLPDDLTDVEKRPVILVRAYNRDAIPKFTVIAARNPFYNRFEWEKTFDDWIYSEFQDFFGAGKSRQWMKRQVELGYKIGKTVVTVKDFETLLKYFALKIESGTGYFLVQYVNR